MLSPGQFHKLVPKDPLKNARFRQDILLRAAHDKTFQAGLKEICKQDILFYICVFVWQYNAMKEPRNRVGPFITWTFQDEALLKDQGILWCLENRKDFVVEKSREMGATWLFLIVMDWLNLFERYHQSLMISKSEKAVDFESPDSLFWKIDFMHERLPTWLKGTIQRRSMVVNYKDTGSYATGEASTGRAGVGGRATEMFIDEFSQIAEDTEVYGRTSDTTGCRMFNGTHKGTGTEFFRLTQSNYIRKLQFHWSQHPDKVAGLYRYNPLTNKVEVIDKTYAFPEDYKFVMDGKPSGGPFPGLRSVWYDEQCKRKPSQRDVAMDLDIDPMGSVCQAFEPLVIHTLVSMYAASPYWEGEVEHENGKPVRLIKRPAGMLKLWTALDSRGCPVLGRYTAGADIAQGTGSTPSCLSMTNAKTGEKVLEYADANINPYKFAALAVFLCRLFKDDRGDGAMLAWEMNGPGGSFGPTVLELDYRRIYFNTNELTDFPREQRQKPGWYPSPNAKDKLLLDYKEALEKREFLNRSERALKETLEFRFNERGNIEHAGEKSKNDPSGARINHGDRVIADALSWMLAKGHGYKERKREEEEAPLLSLAWRRKYHQNRQEAEA